MFAFSFRQLALMILFASCVTAAQPAPASRVQDLDAMILDWLDASGIITAYRNHEADLWENDWRRRDQTLTDESRQFIDEAITVNAITPDMLGKIRKHVEHDDVRFELDFLRSAPAQLLRRLESDCGCAGQAILPEPNSMEDYVDERLADGSISETDHAVLIDYLDSKTHDRFYWRVRRGLDDLMILRRKKLRRGVRDRQR